MSGIGSNVVRGQTVPVCRIQTGCNQPQMATTASPWGDNTVQSMLSEMQNHTKAQIKYGNCQK